MSGYKSSFFRGQAGPETSWDDLITCFPRSIRPTDIDGMVEIDGRFLFLEEKGKNVGFTNRGQRLAFMRLSGLPGVTVVCFREGHLSDLEVLVFRNGRAGAFLGDEPQGFEPCSRDQFKQWLSDWASKP